MLVHIEEKHVFKCLRLNIAKKKRWKKYDATHCVCFPGLCLNGRRWEAAVEKHDGAHDFFPALCPNGIRWGPILVPKIWALN